MPKPHKQAPTWIDSGRRLSRLRTDDVQVDVCVVEAGTARHRRVAWKNGRRQWFEVVVDWSRVKEAT